MTQEEREQQDEPESIDKQWTNFFFIAAIILDEPYAYHPVVPSPQYRDPEIGLTTSEDDGW